MLSFHPATMLYIITRSKKGEKNPYKFNLHLVIILCPRGIKELIRKSTAFLIRSSKVTVVLAVIAYIHFHSACSQGFQTNFKMVYTLWK